jgi:CheY-like chemotaxis protein
MPNVLLIDLARADVAALHTALNQAGHRVTAVGTGLFALTMVERDRPDVIVSRARVSDIDGYELCAILRSDPTTRSVPFLLLAGPDGGDPDAARRVGATRMVPGDASVETIVSEVGALLGAGVETAVIGGPPGAVVFDDGPDAAAPSVGDEPDSAVIVEGTADFARAAATFEPLRPAELASFDPPEPPPTRGLSAGPTLRGSLDVMDLTDLTQAMGHGGKTGHLTVRMPDGDGVIVFEEGRVVHAEYDNLFGEAAFAALVSATHHSSGEFCFTPLDRYSAIAPRTIQRTVEQLLLSIAAEIDEGRTGARAIAPTA